MYLPALLFFSSKCVACACLVSYKLWQYHSVFGLLEACAYYIIWKAELKRLTRARLVHYLLWLAYAICVIKLTSGGLLGVHTLHDFPCQHAGMLNNSNLQVIVAALPKMGTTTLYHALSDLGLRTYHGRDIIVHYPLLWEKSRDFNVAEYLSKCKIDAICLDAGWEHVVEIIKASPDAKIFVMQWRTYEEWLESVFFYFFVHKELIKYILITFYSGMCIFPWSNILNMINRMRGTDIIRLLADGFPSFERMSGFSPSITWESICLEISMGEWIDSRQDNSQRLRSADDFNKWYEQVRSISHAHSRVEIDPTLITYEDLCSHLQIKDCPRRGKLDRPSDLFRSERRAPLSYVTQSIILGIFNYVIFLAFHFFLCHAHSSVLWMSSYVARPGTKLDRWKI